MDLNIWTDSINWLEIVVNLVIIVLVPLVGVALLAAGGAALVKTVKAVIGALRFLVDEPEDVVVVELSELIGLKREDLVAALKRILDAIEQLPEEPTAPTPPVEVNIGGAVK